MAQPVVHFEIIGRNPARLRGYYADLFGWEYDTGSRVAEEISQPDDYGFVNLPRIPGGVGGGAAYRPQALFYVEVPDVGAALERAESLGGTRLMGPVTAPTGLVVGHFTDPEGNLVGLAGPA